MTDIEREEYPFERAARRLTDPRTDITTQKQLLKAEKNAIRKGRMTQQQADEAFQRRMHAIDRRQSTEPRDTYDDETE